MSKYKTWIEIEVVVDYDFQPEEPQVLYPNDKAYPGCHAEVTINEAAIEGLDIYSHLDGGTQQTLMDEIHDWELTHKDYDGPGDPRAFTGPSLLDVLEQAIEYNEENKA